MTGLNSKLRLSEFTYVLREELSNPAVAWIADAKMKMRVRSSMLTEANDCGTTTTR